MDTWLDVVLDCVVEPVVDCVIDLISKRISDKSAKRSAGVPAKAPVEVPDAKPATVRAETPASTSAVTLEKTQIQPQAPENKAVKTSAIIPAPAAADVESQTTANPLQLKNDDFLGYVNHVRHACRGILVKDGKVLLSYEANNGKYIIPGGGVEEGETYAECCEREMLEETGMKVRAVKCYLDIEEMFCDWDHINHYFVCEFVENTGKKHLTEAEERAGCCCAWKELSEALDIFGRYEDYHKSDIAVYGLYRREYTALKEYEALGTHET